MGEKTNMITKSNIKPIEKFPPSKFSYNPKSKVIKPYKKEKVKPMYLPSSPAEVGITNSMDDRIKFNLNMSWGKGSPETHFDRFYSIYPNEEIDNLCQYVFFVRPDLNILNHSTMELQVTKSGKNTFHSNSCPAKDSFLNYMKQHHPIILQNLSSAGFGDHDFIPYLVGRTESIQVPDIEIKEYNISQPYTGFNLPYGSHAYSSLTGGQFEVMFREDKDYKIHKMFKTWVEYIHAVSINKFEPRFTYIKNNKMDYACSVFVITCKPDARTIVFWSKYTGAFPKIVPMSDMSVNLRGTPENKCRITFNFFKQDSLDPVILEELNIASHIQTDPAQKSHIPIYHSDNLKKIGFTKKNSKNKSFSKKTLSIAGSGNSLAGAPFVCVNDIGEFELRWKDVNLTP